MGTIHVEGEVTGIRKSGQTIRVRQMLVDSGAEFTWIPESQLRQAGVSVVKKDLQFVMASGQTITRSIGYAILRVAGFETVDEVVFGQPGDLSRLGARTLEGFGAHVDARHKRLVVSGPHVAAPNH